MALFILLLSLFVMPGPVRGAVSAGILPYSLSTKFSESHAVQAIVNEYHDGSEPTSCACLGRPAHVEPVEASDRRAVDAIAQLCGEFAGRCILLLQPAGDASAVL
jgi:hypothetical protein